jgi:hypothetical protein
MFNVLPQILKEEVTQEYVLRRWIVIVFCTIVVHVVFLVCMVPLVISSTYKKNDIATAIATMKTSGASKDADTVAKTISQTNIRLAIIENKFVHKPLFSIIDDVLVHKPTTVSIQGIMVSSIGTSTATIVVEGVSESRNGLVSFVKDLQQSGVFSTVDLPVSNLAKDKNIDFSLTLNMIK